MVFRRTPEALKNEAKDSSFTIDSYLAQRDEPAEAFTMVEIGHGGVPVAFKQPFTFTGDRAYIGLETWMRGKKEWVHKLMAKRALEDNIFFMSYEPGGTVRAIEEHGETERWYTGPFRTESHLPNEAADEVFASNVFCDPFLAYSRERTQTLLQEMHRIVAPEGTIVLRETITPVYVDEIDSTMLQEVGLQVLALKTIEETDAKSWHELEKHYNGETMNENQKGSFYLFLAKHEPAQTAH